MCVNRIYNKNILVIQKMTHIISHLWVFFLGPFIKYILFSMFLVNTQYRNRNVFLHDV